MKHSINTCLKLLEGGNKYKVRCCDPTQGSEYRGLYELECVDFWCPEDLGDGIACHKLGQKIWVANYFADSMIIETSSYFDNL